MTIQRIASIAENPCGLKQPEEPERGLFAKIHDVRAMKETSMNKMRHAQTAPKSAPPSPTPGRRRDEQEQDAAMRPCSKGATLQSLRVLPELACGHRRRRDLELRWRRAEYVIKALRRWLAWADRDPIRAEQVIANARRRARREMK